MHVIIEIRVLFLFLFCLIKQGLMKKLFSKKKILNREQTDSVRKRWNTYGKKVNPALLNRFYTAWVNLSKFREDRDRSIRYTYGDQWSDEITYKGHVITEKNYIQSKGNIPLVNNIMRSLVNSVTGIYAKQDIEPVCFARNRDKQLVGNMMTVALQCNWQINKMPDLLLTIFEEFLISGMAVARETYEYRDDILDEYTDAANPYYMAWEGGSDPRHTDITLIGQLHDMDFNSLCTQFVNSDTGITIDDLREMYIGSDNGKFLDEGSIGFNGINEKNNINNVSFYAPVSNSQFRVYEIWTKEIKERVRCWDVNSGERYKVELSELVKIQAENEYRLKMGTEYGMSKMDIPLIETEKFIDNYWYYNFLTPSGHVLLEGETPYEFKSHPYTIKLYPFVNGEVHSFTSTFIDQQRYINRLITLNDFILRTSAKGVTLVPEDCIPDDMTPEEFADAWTSVDGLIIYKPKVGSPQLKPEVFHNNSTNIGINEMLQLQLSLIDRISNVTGALQGKSPTSGTSAARYSMESQNATTSLAAILKKFVTFTEDIAKKKVKIMQQFYEDGRYIAVNTNSSDISQFDAVGARDVEFSMSIRESASSPVYRMMINDWLRELMNSSNGLITVEDLLRYGDFPFADKLLQDIESRKQQIQQGNVDGEMLTPDIQQQIGADQESLQMAQQLLSR